MDEYDLYISEDGIVAFNTKSRWDWSEKIIMDPKGAIKYLYDLDNNLRIYFYNAKNDKCFDYLKNRFKKQIEKSGVNRVDEETFYELFNQCYEFEKVSY